MKVKSLSRVRLFAIPWTVVYQASLSMGFSRQEYWSGLPFPSPGDLPDPGIEPRSPALQVDVCFTLWATRVYYKSMKPSFYKAFFDFSRQGYFSTLSVLHILCKAKISSHLTVRTFVYVSDPWTVHPQEQLCLFYLCSLCHLLPPFPLPSTFPYFLLGPGPQQVANKH